MPNNPCPVCQRPRSECNNIDNCLRIGHAALADRLAAMEKWARVFSAFDEPERRFPDPPPSAEPTTVPAPDEGWRLADGWEEVSAGSTMECTTGAIPSWPGCTFTAAYRYGKFGPLSCRAHATHVHLNGKAAWVRVEPAPVTSGPDCLRSLSEDERAKYPVLTEEAINRALMEGERDRRVAENPTLPPMPAPVASGASVPDSPGIPEGWRLATIWHQIDDDDATCDRCDPEKKAAFERLDGSLSCHAHAVETGALVPVEAPKAETAQAAGASHSEDCDVRAGRSRNCSCEGPGDGPPVEQPAEPSAPVGFRVVGRSGPGVEQSDGDWIALARMVDGVALPSCTSTEPRRAWHAPSGPSTCRSTWDAGCYDILEPIVEPAAPPVAAKLSERHRKWVTLYLPLRDKSDGHRYSEEMAALETALDAANESRRALGMDLDAAMRDRGQLREQLNVARREVDATKAENEALRGQRDEAAESMRQAWASNDTMKIQLATRDARIAGLEASHREDVEKAVREERERCNSHWMGGLLTGNVTHVGDRIRNGDPAPKVGG